MTKMDRQAVRYDNKIYDNLSSQLVTLQVRQLHTIWPCQFRHKGWSLNRLSNNFLQEDVQCRCERRTATNSINSDRRWEQFSWRIHSIANNSIRYARNSYRAISSTRKCDRFKDIL